MNSAALLFCLAALAAAQTEHDLHPTLAVGSPAPDFSLPGIDDKIHKLSDYNASPLLLIMFICNHCPTSQLYEGRIQKLVDDYRDKGVASVAIQPNDPSAIRLDELGYTDVSDSLEDMKIRAEYRHFRFPYLYDGETQSVAQAYGVKASRTTTSSRGIGWCARPAPTSGLRSFIWTVTIRRSIVRRSPNPCSDPAVVI